MLKAFCCHEMAMIGQVFAMQLSLLRVLRLAWHSAHSRLRRYHMDMISAVSQWLSTVCSRSLSNGLVLCLNHRTTTETRKTYTMSQHWLLLHVACIIGCCQ